MEEEEESSGFQLSIDRFSRKLYLTIELQKAIGPSWKPVSSHLVIDIDEPPFV